MSKTLVSLLGFLLLVGLVAVVGAGWVQSLADDGPSDLPGRRTFTIRLPEGFGPLERAPVEFGHELHTAALGEMESCTVCHAEREGGGLDHTFVSIPAGASRDEITDAWHGACQDCHDERDQGARTCAECHPKTKPYANLPWGEVALDLRQHQRHVEAMGGACGDCHHAYDEATGTLAHRPGEERSCRDCHRAAPTERMASYRQAAHGQCLTCHMARKAQAKPTGPVACAGCHDAREPLPVVRDMSDVARLRRGQPDTTLIQIADLKMPAVPFNHEGHEKVTGSCRACHHESLQACSTCHTLEGTEAGGYVKLADAYHRPSSSHSCVGCHQQQMKQRTCAVCHGSMPTGPLESGCDVCHSGPLEGGATVRPMTDVESLLPADLPDDIEVGYLADKFEPVAFPHKQIVLKLSHMIGDGRLANVFHGTQAVVCAACHHHSPLGERPPSCARCHRDAFDPQALHRPGLKGAYHQQCIGCHKAMQVDMKVGDHRDCRGCHLEAVVMPGYPQGGGER
jgi:hypothetical protein